MSERFKRVVNDSVALMVIALLVVAIAAIIEVIISKRLFLTDACSKWIYPIIFLKLFIVVTIVWLERRRLKI